MLRHQELLAQKKNELRLLEESISTNKQIIEQQQQQQQQLQLQQINHHYKSNKKAKKDKSAVRTMDPEPTTTSPEPQLSNSAETSPDDYVKQQQSESTNRLKPLTQRRLNRIAHMKKKLLFHHGQQYQIQRPLAVLPLSNIVWKPLILCPVCPAPHFLPFQKHISARHPWWSFIWRKSLENPVSASSKWC